MKRAFTILELMIVVSIVGLLVAIAVPNYQAAKRKAKLLQQQPPTSPPIKIGDLVVIGGINATGMVNDITGFNYEWAEVLIKDTTWGEPKKLSGINIKVLRKVENVENQ